MPAGRPTDFKSEYCEQAEKLCKLGATDEEIAEFFEVSTRTIHRWKHTHENFCHSINVGKEVADERVARSLYQKATGFYFIEQQAFKLKRGSNLEEIEIAEVERFQPADTTAGIFWLKNRRKEEWRDKQEVEHTVPEELLEKLWGQ